MSFSVWESFLPPMAGPRVAPGAGMALVRRGRPGADVITPKVCAPGADSSRPTRMKRIQADLAIDRPQVDCSKVVTWIHFILGVSHEMNTRNLRLRRDKSNPRLVAL